ncbi:hypothetical protein FQ330_03070 [Agrococcus sediminis]|uniref:Uncharacterized protein n=1 Tax=Agrococcus sediminis TaxID=2599924 RepID=A0A5M8QN16_9MICO|nr:hypothetical protein [Agrococcus sediminis]KAA6436400.1 hypothetical protein FQ330_03070 [Agrococcus sediminis]
MEFHDIEDVAHRLDVTTESLEPLWSQVVERWNHSSHDLLTPLADIALTVASEQGVTLTPEDV